MPTDLQRPVDDAPERRQNPTDVYPEQRDQLQRIAGEADDPVQPDHQRAPEAVVLARPGGARIAVVEDAGLAKTDQPHQPAQEAVGLLAARRRCRPLGGSSAGSPRCSAGSRHRRCALISRSRVPRRCAWAASLPRACAAAHRRRHSPRASASTSSGISSGGSCRSQSITTTASPRGRLHAGDRRHRLAEAAREAQHLHARVALAQRQDQLLGAIGARIDAEDQLPLEVQLAEHLAQALVDALDVVLLVVGGDHDAQHSRCDAARTSGGCPARAVKALTASSGVRARSGRGSRTAAGPRARAALLERAGQRPTRRVARARDVRGHRASSAAPLEMPIAARLRCLTSQKGGYRGAPEVDVLEHLETRPRAPCDASSPRA